MMQNRIRTFLLYLLVIVPLVVAVFILSQEASAEETGSFAGTWVANGQRQAFDFVEGREVGTFKLAGHVSLKDKLGEIEDFWAECVGLSDSVTGSSVRCVWWSPGEKSLWRSPIGKKAYSVLRGQPLKEGVKVTGEFVGGTGSLKGLTGMFSFTWTSTFTDEDQGIFTGHTKDLSGSYRIP